jgi:uncharacterized protein
MIVYAKIKPNQKRPGIEEKDDGSLIVRLKSPAKEGKANLELIEVLAKRYGVPKASVRIKSGFSAKTKLIEIGF